MPTQSWSWVNGTCFLVFAICHSSILLYKDIPGYAGSWHAWTLKYHQPILGQIHMSISTCVQWNMQTKSDIQALLWNNLHISLQSLFKPLFLLLFLIVGCLVHPAKVFLIHIAHYLISGNKIYFNQFLAPYLTIITTMLQCHSPRLSQEWWTQTIYYLHIPHCENKNCGKSIFLFSIYLKVPWISTHQHPWLVKWWQTWTIISNVILHPTSHPISQEQEAHESKINLFHFWSM